MISDHIEANSLIEYYKKLYKLQADAHREDYMLVHDEICKCLKNCNSYTEFGINQGATLAAAVLATPNKVRAYDIKFGWYNEAHVLFSEYATINNIDYEVFEMDTLKCKIDQTDLLYIDTRHRYSHLTKELQRHGPMVRKYIIFHDTYTHEGLRKAVQEYVEKNPEWEIVTDCKINVGFMTIKRNIKSRPFPHQHRAKI